jgi:hypothetical protein
MWRMLFKQQSTTGRSVVGRYARKPYFMPSILKHQT